MNILLTGGSGFVGRAICERLSLSDDNKVTLALRRNSAAEVSDNRVIVEGLSISTDWSAAVVNQHVVIHSAARVHVVKEKSVDPLKAFREVNVEGTLSLAQQAASAGVRRFIFISTVKVNGEVTDPNKPFTAFDPPAPLDCYGISKFEAEAGLKRLAAKTGMEVVIIRPVLVYGPGVKANFRSIIKWLYEGMPLPLGAINNKRSFVALDNLVDLICTCISHPAAANQTFLVSDGEDISVSQLLRGLGEALNKPARLIPVPPVFIDLSLRALGKAAVGQRLCKNLQVDISHTCETLGWRPPVSVKQALKKTTDAYIKER